MERLTRRISEDCIELSAKANPTQYQNIPQRIYKNHPFWNVFNKLCEQEDVEEQGLLLRLPCKVGDIVYQITRDFISEYRIRNFIHYDNGNIFFDWECIKGIYLNVKGFHIDDIGKTAFLTKEEAEQKLVEMEDKNGQCC